ncbi:MAG: HAMP domain-containing protein [Gammaproteobacteria bacterium]|nr:HAMP domain-containing protein [Gammaproteobacteria bacterium]
MKKSVINWLQIKVFAGLGVLIIGAAVIIIYINLLAEENHASQQLLSQVKQLETQGQAIKRRGATYASNAPRDYAPYFRDLVIFYPDFMNDLDAFESQIQQIEKTASALPIKTFHSVDNSLMNSITTLKDNWLSFRRGLMKKLGDNLKEPRLEWGADYVQENQQLINQITGYLIKTIDDSIEKQLHANKELTNRAFIGAGISLLLGIIWFYVSVIRRITQTIKGCQRVAQGDFGYQLKVRGNDELAALSDAFNTLSARTRFVVTMLSKMHRHGSAENKVDSLYKEATGYLPIEWLGLWHLNEADENLSMMSMRSERTASHTALESLSTMTTKDLHLLDIIKSQQTIKYDNLQDQAAKLTQARLMNAILKMGLLKSVLIVPLKSDDNWQGLLVFVAGDEYAYSDEQVELMTNLAPFIANGFSQAEKI